MNILHLNVFFDSFYLTTLEHLFFAFLAGFGFGFALNAPRKALWWSGFLAGFGHTFRSFVMVLPVFNFAGASFITSLLMGFLGALIAKKLKTPVEVVVFPALLPMFPGRYGCESIISLLHFLGDHDDPSRLTDLLAFFNKFMVTFSVSLALVAGVLIVLPFFSAKKIKN